MCGMGVWEIFLILFIVLLIFGGNKLPQLGAGIGKGIRNFKKSLKGEDEIDITPTDKEKIGRS
jgi:sec-independent protein translocase protein TatA